MAENFSNHISYQKRNGKIFKDVTNVSQRFALVQLQKLQKNKLGKNILVGRVGFI